MRRISIAVAWSSSIALVVTLFLVTSRPIVGQAQPKGEDGDLGKRLEKVEKAQRVLADFVRLQAIVNPPVGSVVGFAGKWPPKRDGGSDWTEQELGWILCDGRKLEGDDFAALRLALGKDVSPDYRGYFLRGTDPGSLRDKGARDAAGEQQDSTRLPRSRPFVTDDSGSHTHAMVWKTPPDDGKLARWPRDWGNSKGTPAIRDFSAMNKDGSHAHSVTSGGDDETRPVNKSVTWIIKFR